MPKSRLEFWLPKLEGNKRRDVATQRKLGDLGWEFQTQEDAISTSRPK